MLERHGSRTVRSYFNLLLGRTNSIALGRLRLGHDVPAGLQAGHGVGAIGAGDVGANLSTVDFRDAKLHAGDSHVLIGGTDDLQHTVADELEGVRALFPVHDLNGRLGCGGGVTIGSLNELDGVVARVEFQRLDDTGNVGSEGVDQRPVLLPDLDDSAGDGSTGVLIDHIHSDAGLCGVGEGNMCAGAALDLDGLRLLVDGITIGAHDFLNGVAASGEALAHGKTIRTSHILTNHNAIRLASNLEACAFQHQLRVLGVDFLNNEAYSLVLEVNRLLLASLDFHLDFDIDHGVIVRSKYLLDGVPAGLQVSHNQRTSHIGLRVEHDVLVTLTGHNELSAGQILAGVLILKDDNKAAVLGINEVTIVVHTILNSDGLAIGAAELITGGCLGFGHDVVAGLQVGEDCLTVRIGFQSTNQAVVGGLQLKHCAGDRLVGHAVNFAGDKGCRRLVLNDDIVELTCLDADLMDFVILDEAVGRRDFLHTVDTGSQGLGRSLSVFIRGVLADDDARLNAADLFDLEHSARHGRTVSTADFGNRQRSIRSIGDVQDGVLPCLYRRLVCCGIERIAGCGLRFRHNILAGVEDLAVGVARLIGSHVLNDSAIVTSDLEGNSHDGVTGYRVGLIDLDGGLRHIHDSHGRCLICLHAHQSLLCREDISLGGLGFDQIILAGLHSVRGNSTRRISGVGLIDELAINGLQFEHSASQRSLGDAIHLVNGDALRLRVGLFDNDGSAALDFDLACLSV